MCVHLCCRIAVLSVVLSFFVCLLLCYDTDVVLFCPLCCFCLLCYDIWMLCVVLSVVLFLSVVL